jgi:arginyl-tRNA synthetase
MSSIIRNSKRKAQSAKLQLKTQNFELLNEPEELRLIKKLIQFPDLLEDISRTYRMHLLPYYAIELADIFHKFYEQCRVLSDNEELTSARLGLVMATKTVLKNALKILGVSAPERM